MKITDLAYLTRSQLTSLATAMAQMKVDGFKGTSKTILKVFSCMESKSVEALLSEIDKRHSKAYKIKRKEITVFEYLNGEKRLSQVDVIIDVKGFSSNYINIFNSIFDLDYNCLSNKTYPSISSGGRQNTYSCEEQNENLQMAINYSFELCKQINKIRKNDVVVKDFEKDGWTVLVKKINKELKCEVIEND